MATLYENIKSMCDERGVKPSRMCQEAGVSKSIISMLKSGEKKYISLEVAKKIANYFCVSVDDILGGTLQGNLEKEMHGYRMGREAEKENPAAPKNDGGNVFELAIKNLCGDDQKKLALLMDSLSKNPEKTKASFDLFLKTL